MRLLWEGPGFRRASYWVLIAAFVTLSTYAGAQAFSLQESLQEKEYERTKRELDTTLALWERAVLDRVSTWIQDVADAEDPRAIEDRYRRSSRYFEAFYIWRPGPQGPVFLYPEPPLEEHIDALMADGCMAAAARLSDRTSALQAARAYELCLNRDAPVALLASSRAADLYLSAERPAEALDVLERGPVPLLVPVENAASYRVSAYRLVARRLQAADAAEALGDAAKVELILSRTGREITDLDGRALDILLPFVDYPILEDLRELGAEAAADRIEERMFEARRRLLGYLEVAQRIGVGNFPQSVSDEDGITPQIELAYDQYGDRTYLLAYGPIETSGSLVAIQLDQLGLLASLLDAARPNLRRQVLVLDANGDIVLAADSTFVAPVWFQVPFGSLLPHLRLAIKGEASVGAGPALRFLATQLVPLGLAIALGSIALFTRIKADRELRDLVARQQAFVARVTHELKTPLAGVRVMAETLLMGVADDPTRRQDFLERILQETERLQARIDEVLRAASRTGTSAMEPLALDQLTTQVLEPWRSRLEHEGIALHTELHPCPVVSVDKALLTDAINNLVDNALKYRRTDRPSVLWLTTRATRSRCILEVTDNGHGVPAKDRKLVFEPFRRVERPGRGKAGGHGLGLAFVLEAARIHGGTAECREGIDGGARFIFTIRR